MIRWLRYFLPCPNGRFLLLPALAPPRPDHLLFASQFGLSIQRIASKLILHSSFVWNPIPPSALPGHMALMEGDMWVAVTALVLAAAIGFDVIAVALRRSDHSDLTDKV
jgi:hypothetical protein